MRDQIKLYGQRLFSLMLPVVICTVLLLAGCSGDSGSADNPPDGVALETTIVRAGPIKLSECRSVLTQTTSPTGDSVPHLWVSAKLANPGSKTATAVIVQYSTYTAFGEKLSGDQTHYALFNFTIAGKLEANVDNFESAGIFDGNFPTVGKVHCEMARVKFEDGSEWSNPSVATI